MSSQNSLLRSLTGPYYWVPSGRGLSPSWGILATHDFGLDPDTGHTDLWPHVLTRLAADWGKDAAVVRRRLGFFYTGLPRGRVTKPEKVCLILHGNDAPAPAPGWVEIIKAHFRFNGRRSRLLFDEHETQLPGHPEAFETVFGSPYQA